MFFLFCAWRLENITAERAENKKTHPPGEESIGVTYTFDKTVKE